MCDSGGKNNVSAIKLHDSANNNMTQTRKYMTPPKKFWLRHEKYDSVTINRLSRFRISRSHF